MLYLYNTLTRQKEEFKPINPPLVGLYTCGPTVYIYDHIGHAWNYTAADILRRVLEFNEYKVKHVMNITDVGHLTSDGDTGEDKMEKSAQQEKKSVWEIAKFYTDIYLANRQKINLLTPTIICKATGHIPEMIDLIKRIEKKGATYIISDGVYFDISKFSQYGKLSGNTLEQLKAGARLEINPEKKHPADFALWKFSPKDSKRQMEWDSPWGKGFPGWHIECSAMSMKYLGEHFDLHTGGEDNKFPHHECEIAQSETATNKKFVNYWLHTKFLMVDGEKMSKSLKNCYRLEDLEKKDFNPLSLRYLFLTAHYRSALNFTWQSLEASQNALNNLYEIFRNYKNPSLLVKIFHKKDLASGEKYEEKFLQAINDDLDMPKAMAVVWELIKSNIPDWLKKQILLKFDKVLGLKLKELKPIKIKIPQEIKALVQEREKARKEKNWSQADEIRKKIESVGWILEDSFRETKVRKK